MEFNKINFKDKLVFVRVDFNVPLQFKGKGFQLTLSARMEEHAKTIKTLIKKKAKIVLLAHQSKPGKKDFVDLHKHALLLSELIKKPVLFVPDVIGKEAQTAVSNLKAGEVLLLDNVRKIKDEMECPNGKCDKASLIKTYQKVCDYFVLDAFSVAHRSQASVVGFKNKTVYGPVLSNELKHLEKLRKSKNVVLIFGGGKPEDTLKILKKWLQQNRAKKIILCGIPGMLLVSNFYTNKQITNFIESKGYKQLAKEFFEISKKHEIFIPRDVSLEGKIVPIEEIPKNKGEIVDIGPKTINYFSKAIKGEIVLYNGTAGLTDVKEYSVGTTKLLKAITRAKKSYIGGGDTLMILKTNKISQNKFTFVSLSGKAFIQYVSGDELVALKSTK
ncbi:phosphoglycerate kinase [Candidatus Micrarchaeota archaeon]|jgi:phosphoglycerate kinase|nr:phosphoglycerate kinase [Candidatus Micrarchaeota archaeon]